MADDSLAIELRHVTKLYKRRVLALDGVQLNVRRGEVFGLLGPNGAGKSTLVKIMMSVTRPTRIDGEVLGKPVGSKTSLAKVGYLPEHHRFPKYLTGRQTLEFFAALSNVDKPTRKKRAAELLETVGMTAWADAKVGSYSKGMMQRVGVAQALVNEPELVVLDEPTDGVDPVGRREIRDVLLKMKAQGRTVFINSHLLQELELICDRVAILARGQVVSQGTIDELTRGQQCFSIELADANNVQSVLQSHLHATFGAAAGEGTLPDGVWLKISGPQLQIGTTDVARVQPIIDGLRAGGLIIRRIQPVRPSLEDLFMEAVGGMGGGHSAGAVIRGGHRP